MKKLPALMIGSLLFFTSTAFAFSDLTTSHWAYQNIMDMQSRGIISGFTDNTFRPDASLTREQFITLAVKGLNIENTANTVSFEDSYQRWSEPYVKAAGVTMTDEGDLKFRPTDLALREDIAMSIVRLNGLEDATYSLNTLNRFSDVAEISETRKKYVAIAVENGFMSGNANGTFAAKNALTRAEGATVIFNMLDKIGNNSNGNFANWNGSYISNDDGLVKVELEKISDSEVKFIIKGKRSSIFAAYDVATIVGDTAIYRYNNAGNRGEIKFSFSGYDLLIETSGYDELEAYSGQYHVDNGTFNTLNSVSEKNPLEGNYSLNSLNLSLLAIAPESVNYEISGMVDGRTVYEEGTLQKQGNKWKHFDIFYGMYLLEIELMEDEVVVTGLSEEYYPLSGIYEKVPENASEEFKRYEEAIDSVHLAEGVFLL